MAYNINNMACSSTLKNARVGFLLSGPKMSTYCKPHLTFEKQLELLKSRGLIVTNDDLALEYLNRLGYYRLSGYWYPCRELIPIQNGQAKPIRPQRKDTFKLGARFQDVVDLSIFDKKLRLLILDAIERIEVAFRVDIAYLLGKKDKFAYMKPELLHANFNRKVNPKTGKTKYQEWLQKHEQMVSRSREDFVEHYKIKYKLPLPIWVAIELWDFGLMAVFYQGMNVSDKIALAEKYNIPDWQVMESWLRCLNYARNVAAHHSRLWNRNLVDQPKLAKKGVMSEFDFLIENTHARSRVYVILCILSHFMHQICPRSEWSARLFSLIDSFPKTDHFNVADMGFPLDWKVNAIWKR